MPILTQYDENGCSEKKDISIGECLELINRNAVNWINIEGTTGPDFDLLVDTLGIHQLMVEDIRNRSQLPKFEVFNNLSFLSIQMIQRHPATLEVSNEHLSILLQNQLIVTVQEDLKYDVFDGIRQKIKLNYKRMAKNGIDYLFLSFIDAIIDEYMATVNSFRQPIDDLEITMVKRPTLNTMKLIMELKAKLNWIRRLTVPLREELQRIRTENPDLIKKHNQILFRDLQDHITTLITNFESYREMLRDLAELNNSNQNLQLNNTMKTLTSISAVFIPLTFIVGVYGMNFKSIPELDWKYGYPAIWLIMLAITGFLIWYMKKKKWF